mmetsp:Transcript_21277/g.31664  ORF Transcript_21277/g.31664 Transcript_21277/m.31664 type:complete len:176 (+) Transcript_21277:27-554(+)|eukprot:CAMPEP_0201551826 /NCGR_PEP_ID=MMETSP0173_2-20130828/10660_1 /ASSEMBLY_ACC=CAM_ASM_000268 /TAXON_ID=218659 /ORGANISM="Vexillifera sp., Strain DIVA3 564/2" /LENGTH=175 /DNA_ID=CAMNT_0047962175 /DNA_START=22 /DNA_END=549 /DNA_ORIENTATION=-
MERDPCPKRIWTDMGGAFTMGAVAGSLMHGYKGARNAPRGDKLRGLFRGIRVKAPMLGGQFAVWGGCFSTFDCSLSYIRGTEDQWNSISAGAFTGALLAARQGLKAAVGAGIAGGLILGIMEGIMMFMSGGSPFASKELTPEQMGLQVPAGGVPPGAASSSSSSGEFYPSNDSSM